MKRSVSGSVGLACLLAALLGGCQVVPPKAQPAGEAGAESMADSAPAGASDELPALLDRFSRASPGELKREYEALASLPEAKQGGDVRLRLALLLAQPGLPFRDDAAALRVLQEWENGQTQADPAHKAFVRWLRAMLGERVRLAGSLEDAGARLREEKKRAEVCKDKLEAIKSMERSLIERDRH